MSIKPIPKDANDKPLIDRGTQIFTYRIEAQDTTLTDLSLATDFKEVLIHYEGSTQVAKLKGTITDSTEIFITSDGITITLPIVAEEDAVFIQVAAPADTKNISIIAWR